MAGDGLHFMQRHVTRQDFTADAFAVTPPAEPDGITFLCPTCHALRFDNENCVVSFLEAEGLAKLLPETRAFLGTAAAIVATQSSSSFTVH